MFKATAVEIKLREINLLNNMQINIFHAELQTIITHCLTDCHGIC